MKVLLTFDTEIWCDGWQDLDGSFDASFERYVYGRSLRGEYALPKTLEILNRFDLRGVFFVEPLFSARFGANYLRRIVDLIQSQGHDVQLHLHPEWADEITPPLLEAHSIKRPLLSSYTLAEQRTLIAAGRDLLHAAGAKSITSFRAGNFAANRETYVALRDVDLLIDSSMNACYAISGADLRSDRDLLAPMIVEGVSCYPVFVFRDGLGRLKPAQVSGCGYSELSSVLWKAKALGHKNFVIVSHNFELLESGSAIPDEIVVRRFENLCAFLAEHRREFATCTFSECEQVEPAPARVKLPQAPLRATAIRLAEQIRRRI